MSKMQHAACVALLMAGAGGLLGWLAGHTDILFADGLRYIEQARRIDRGAWADGLTRSVDHPIYPMAIAAAHRLDGREGPEGWQEAAQLASVVAGILLVVPLYLVAFELFGGTTAWLACLLVYLVPLSGHVMADTLSESTFLLFLYSCSASSLLSKSLFSVTSCPRSQSAAVFVDSSTWSRLFST